MAQITEDYVSFETAKLLKEKGFDAPVKNYYSIYTEDAKYNLQKKYGAKKNWNSLALSISRPSQSLVMKWLRKQHEYIILFDVSAWGTYDWYYIYKGNRYHYEEMTFEYNEKEEAAESAIKYCLEKLI